MGSSLKINHDKWFISLKLEKITIKYKIYNLIATENKRNFIKYESGLIIDTDSFRFN